MFMLKMFALLPLYSTPGIRHLTSIQKGDSYHAEMLYPPGGGKKAYWKSCAQGISQHSPSTATNTQSYQQRMPRVAAL